MTKKLEDLDFIPEKGELRMKGIRYSLVATTVFAQMIKQFESIIGPAITTMIYQMTFDHTKDFVKKVVKLKILAKFAAKTFPKKVAEEIVKNLAQYGLGKLTVEKLDLDGESILRLENSPIGTLFKDRKTPVCSYISGIIAGGTTGFFGKEYECEEIECVAKGDKACKFILRQCKSSK